MTTPQSVKKHGTRWIVQLGVFVGFSIGVIVALLWLAGWFSPKLRTDQVADESRVTLKGKPTPVRLVRLPVTESAVGTVRAVHEITVGSKLLARVVDVNLKAGQKVKKGEVLVQLEAIDLKAKLSQAKAALVAAEAMRGQATIDEKRYRQLIASHAVSQQEYDRAVTALRSADAEVQRTQEAVNEVQAMLDWATVRSPIDGTVIDKRVESGDMVTPGQPLVTLFDPTRMQLVASVREALTQRLHPGQDIAVRLDGLEKQCLGQVSEVVPEAQSASRAFQVKVTGPCPKGVYSGMFGRILIPVAGEDVLIVPRSAVRRVGQLELVDVIEDGRPIQRAVRTGRSFDTVTPDGGGLLKHQVEILSGLRKGEIVVAPHDSQPDVSPESCPVDQTKAPAQEAQ